jgi:uncharacterized protein (DUF427 family)
MSYHKITYYLTALSVLLGVALGTASCTDNEVETIAEKKAEAYVTLTINTGGVAASRSLSFTDEQGSEIENYINPNDVHLYFFPDNATAVQWNSDGSSSNWKGWGGDVFLQNVTPTDVWKTSDHTYMLTCKLDETASSALLTQSAFRVAVYVNCGSRSSYSNSSLIFFETNESYGAYYNYPNVFGLASNPTAFTPSEETPIPMFGLIRKTNFKLVQGKAVNLGTVNMIRSMAKIEVKTNKTNVKLSDVTLTTCTTKGAFTPFAMWVESDFSEANDGFYIGIPYEHHGTGTSVPTTSNLPFTKVSDSDYVIYVPEMRQVGQSLDGSGATKKISTDISLKFNDIAYTIYFKEYNDDGEPVDNTDFNIIRNHIYRYTVEPASTKIAIKYVVEPWTEQTAGDITFD